MRRLIFVLALLVACALMATPALAQSDHNRWFFNAGVGPSFGTFGSTAAANASGGYRFGDHLALAGEVGILPHASFDKAASIAPSVSPVMSSSDVHVNAYHANANMFVQPSSWGRFTPYATAGFGAFTGSTVASTATASSHIVQYSRETNPATNLGVGATYRLTDWLGVNADYRHFVVNAADTEHVNRFTTGVSLFVHAPFVK
jgi:opacity protein-like surface antigen